MIKIEIDGDKRDVCAKGTGANILIQTMIAVEAIIVPMANDAEEYNLLRDVVVEGIMLADYDEVKENIFENE